MGNGAWTAIAEISNARIFHFPQGMAGFPNTTDYILLYPGRGDIVCLQSTQRPEAAFLVTPWDEARIGARPDLTPEQRVCLNDPGENDLIWLVVLNPFVDTRWVLANTRAPVAINMKADIGLQSVQTNEALRLRHPWMLQPGQAEQATGAVCA